MPHGGTCKDTKHHEDQGRWSAQGNHDNSQSGVASGLSCFCDHHNSRPWNPLTGHRVLWSKRYFVLDYLCPATIKLSFNSNVCEMHLISEIEAISHAYIASKQASNLKEGIKSNQIVYIQRQNSSEFFVDPVTQTHLCRYEKSDQLVERSKGTLQIQKLSLTFNLSMN